MSVSRLALPLGSRLHRAIGALAHSPSRLLHRSVLARSRRRLALLDDHLLRDIGVTRAEAEAEAARRGWDAPSHWRD